MLAFGIAMLIQAGYTLLYLTGLLGSFEPWSLRALLVDDTAGAQAEPAG